MPRTVPAAGVRAYPAPEFVGEAVLAVADLRGHGILGGGVHGVLLLVFLFQRTQQCSCEVVRYIG